MSQDFDISARTFNRDIAPVKNGEVICYEHELPARQFTSKTVANPGRKFFVCGKKHDDPERCRFFIWADDSSIIVAMGAASTQATATQPQVNTPPRPSQAKRANIARLPTTPISNQKRRRTPSPPPSLASALAGNNPGTPKQRRLDGGSGNGSTDSGRTRLNTPALTPSQRAAREAEIKKGLEDAKKLARLKSIEEALAAVQGTPQGNTPSGSSRPSGVHDFSFSTGRSSRRELIEATHQQTRNQRLSDVSMSISSSSFSSSESQNQYQNRSQTDNTREQTEYFSRPNLPSSQATQSEAGQSITSEIEEADMEDECVGREPEQCDEIGVEVEDKGIQTDPIDDEDSIMEDFFNLTPAYSVMGTPVSSIPFTLPASSSNVDSACTRPLGVSRGSWTSPAPSSPQNPSPTFARAGPTRTRFTPDGNEDVGAAAGGADEQLSMLLTPPGSSQIDRGGGPSSASQRGTGGARGRSAQEHIHSLSPPRSPTSSVGTRGKGRERPLSRWQMIQDDPENPFHERAAALWGSSPVSTIAGVIDVENESTRGTSSVSSVPLSADKIAQQLASLAELPDYIRKLERRERAAQKSAEIKAKKIVQLEEEVQRLRNEKRALEETVSALQVRR